MKGIIIFFTNGVILLKVIYRSTLDRSKYIDKIVVQPN